MQILLSTTEFPPEEVRMTTLGTAPYLLLQIEEAPTEGAMSFNLTAGGGADLENPEVVAEIFELLAKTFREGTATEKES